MLLYKIIMLVVLKPQDFHAGSIHGAERAAPEKVTVCDQFGGSELCNT